MVIKDGSSRGLIHPFMSPGLGDGYFSLYKGLLNIFDESPLLVKELFFRNTNLEKYIDVVLDFASVIRTAILPIV